MDDLSLRDELFLLAHDEVGRMVVHEATLDAGLAGATLIDLVLAGRLGMRDGCLVALVAPSFRDEPAPSSHDKLAPSCHDKPAPSSHDKLVWPGGDPIADLAVAAIAAEPAPSGPRAWVAWLGDGMCARVTAALTSAGVVRRTTARRLGVLPVARTLPTPPDLAATIRARLRSAVSGVDAPAPRTAALCGLTRVSRLEGMLRLPVPTGELLGRLDGIVSGQDEPIRLIVAAVDAAAHR